jgi:HEAT repeat protein
MDDQHVIHLLRQFSECLENPDPERNPLGEIEEFGDAAVPRLAEALDHEDPLIRRMAVCVLGCLHSPHGGPFDLAPAIPRLEAVLQADPDSLVRLYAAEALWTIREDKSAIRVLVGGLQDSRAEARRHAATMLGVVGPEASQAVQPLIEALGDSDVVVRRYAAEDLAAFGPAAVAALPNLESLLGEDEWTQVVGAEAISKIAPCRSKELGPILVAALRSGSSRIRYRATEALGALPLAGQLAVSELIDALDDEDEMVRTEAISALGRLGPAAVHAISALTAILQGHGMDSDDLLIRGMAASALGNIGPEARKAVPDLIECLHESEVGFTTARLRLQVARALWKIRREPAYLVSIGIEALGDPKWSLRRLAAAWLGDLGPAALAVVPHLKRAMKDEHPAVRRQAAASLIAIVGDGSRAESRLPARGRRTETHGPHEHQDDGGELA